MLLNIWRQILFPGDLEGMFVPQAAPQAKKLFLQAASQARKLLRHRRQEGFCRTTGKKAFAAPQARRFFVPHHRQEGFCRTYARWLCCRTREKQVNLQILPKIETGLVYLETELVLPGEQFLTTV